MLKSILKRFLEDNVLNRYVKGAFWAISGNVIVKGLSLLSSIFVARYLGKINFGGLAIIKTTLSVFSLFATLGLGFTVTKFIADKRANSANEVPSIIAAAKRITITSGGVLGITIILFAQLIATQILLAENLTEPLRISGIYLFFNTLNVYQVGVIGGLEAYKKMAKINLIIGAISFPTVVAGAYFWGLNGVFMALTFNLFVNWYLFEQLIKREISSIGFSIKVKPKIEQIKKLLKFSLPLALSEGVYAFTNWILIYLLLIKTDYGEVGLFNSANHWMQMILFLPGALSNVLLSFLSNQSDNQRNYFNILKTNLIFNLTITLSLSLIIALFSNYIFGFYGTSFEGGADILFVLVFSSIPMSLINTLEQVCISRSKTKLVFSFKLMRQIILIILAFVMFNHKPEAISLALAFNIGYFISLFIIAYYLFRIGLLTKSKFLMKNEK